jgi:hypothetical protein
MYSAAQVLGSPGWKDVPTRTPDRETSPRRVYGDHRPYVPTFVCFILMRFYLENRLGVDVCFPKPVPL